MRGTITFWSPKGYGFLARDGGAPVFHVRAAPIKLLEQFARPTNGPP